MRGGRPCEPMVVSGISHVDRPLAGRPPVPPPIPHLSSLTPAPARTLLFLVIALAATLTACATAGATRDGSPMEQIECGGQSGAVGERSGFALYGDPPTFAAAYVAIHAGQLPPPPVVAVDFDHAVVAAAFLGRRPSAGYGIHLTGAVRDGDRLVVTVERQAPPAGAITAQVITSPYCLVRLTRGNWRAVRFVDPEGHRLAEVALPTP